MTVKVKVNTTLAYEVLAFERSQHCIARAPNGTIWIVYTDSDGTTGDLLVAYSSDGGATWTEETAVPNARARGYICLGLLVDSANIPIIIYGYYPAAGNPEIRYVDRSGGSWGTPETVVTIATRGTPLQVLACIDSLNNIHMAYTQRIPLPAYETHYATGISSSWSTEEKVDDEDFPMDITVNSKNEPIVCFGTSGCFLRLRTGGIWSAADTFDASGAGWYPKVAIDSSDNYHVIWQGVDVGYYKIYYRKKTGEVWGTVIEVVSSNLDDWSNPILVLDSRGDAYIVYQYYKGTSESEAVWYKKITSGVLGSQVTLDADALQPNTYPSTYSGLWHRFPTSGILAAKFQPAVALLSEHQNGFPHADLYFEAAKFVVKAIKGNPHIDQRIYQHVERMER